MGAKTLSKIKLPEIISKNRVPIGIVFIFFLVTGYFYVYNQFWTHLDPEPFEYLTEYTGSRIRGHRGRQVLVHRDFHHIVDQVNRYAVKNNLHIIITHSFRAPDKKVNDAIVTPAVKSNHLAGHAIDFNIVYGGKVFESKDLINVRFSKLPVTIKYLIFDIQSDARIRWGGDFETQDPIHLDDSVNINDPVKWEQHYHQCLTDYVNATPKWLNWLKNILKG